MAEDPDSFGDQRRQHEALESLAAVLDVVRHGHAKSRLEIAQRTGLSRAIVAIRVAELVDLGLLSASGVAPSTGGRPPRRLRFVAGAGHVLVADLGATSIDVAAIDLGGEILRQLAEPADIAAGPETVLARVEWLFDRLVAEAEVPGPLVGIGIGLPGPVEFRTGRPIAPPIMPGWDGYPVRERFAARHDVPVWVDNDVNTMAVGEERHGIARGHQNMVFVKIGTGIGAGLISDGQLHRGSQGSAGDVGHIQVADDRAIVCRCGKIGCLEAVAGGSALARDAEAAARSGRSERLAAALARGPVRAEDVAEAAAHGDPVAVELLERAGRNVGRMLASVVNFFNPSLIVIGGGVAGAGDVLIAAIREVVYARSLPLATRDLRIERSALGDRAGVLGAAAIVLDELLSAERLEMWGRAPRTPFQPVEPVASGVGAASLVTAQ
ncbi:MAG: ROK family protein [Chloroflexota bacterium]